ncbi:uncharacterized protein LOC141667192 [Apium graveolens]|uniref:uncharacterized protein LOC141667192 n=1 Tax=Apium graveolens TaxID=4045 RepID=UPI003D7BF520
MDQQSKYMKEIEDKYAALDIGEDEGNGVEYKEEIEESDNIDTRWSLVGRLLVDIPVDFNAMQNTLAGLWKPGKGLYVKELGTNLYLFQFNHELDIKRVMEGSPWTFNRALLVFERLKAGVNPTEIELNHIDIWAQVYDLQAGFRSERVIKDIGDYIGSFVQNDANNFSGVWREFYRVRVRIDINKPLRRKMKLKKKGGDWFWVNFKYEHAPTFCFICGIIGHSERFCPKLFQQEEDIVERPYGAWLRAAPRRSVINFGAKWLRQEPVVVKRTENVVDPGVQAARGGDEREQQSRRNVMEGGEIRGDNSGIRDGGKISKILS